jgi:hypothetical protein
VVASAAAAARGEPGNQDERQRQMLVSHNFIPAHDLRPPHDPGGAPAKPLRW